MSIGDFIARKAARDTAVYWAAPTSDGYGGLTWADPVEINCVWMEKFVLIGNNNSQAITSMAQAYLTQDVVEHGMLYHGSLDDLSSGETGDPRTKEGAYEIKMIKKEPSLRNPDEYLRIAYL